MNINLLDAFNTILAIVAGSLIALALAVWWNRRSMRGARRRLDAEASQEGELFGQRAVWRTTRTEVDEP